MCGRSWRDAQLCIFKLCKCTIVLCIAFCLLCAPSLVKVSRTYWITHQSSAANACPIDCNSVSGLTKVSSALSTRTNATSVVQSDYLEPLIVHHIYISTCTPQMHILFNLMPLSYLCKSEKWSFCARKMTFVSLDFNELKVFNLVG